VDGTLQFRMRKGSAAYQRVNAKTGSFTGISTLAGYLKTNNGHDIAFAIMNQNAMSLSKANEFQNKVCEVVCGE
jgi:D-alanyl-D-alanine carboxypeptidase/D-alanyl-D-alanine-endopeptidase (penicillin-binding protein 4)